MTNWYRFIVPGLIIFAVAFYAALDYGFDSSIERIKARVITDYETGKKLNPKIKLLTFDEWRSLSSTVRQGLLIHSGK